MKCCLNYSTNLKLGLNLHIMSTLKLITLLFFLFNLQTITLAQKKVKWGKLSKTEKEITQFEDDTTSTAIVLADIGHVYVSYSTPIAVDRHLRIKITKQKGIDEYGVFEQVFYAKDRSERITSIKAQVLNIEGEIVVKQKVDKSAIYTEEINEKWSRIKVAFPSLTVGSIIEISYTHKYDGYFSMREWYFQREIPTLFSSLTAEVEAAIDYRIQNFGATLQQSHSFLGKVTDESNLKTWTAENLRAIRDEVWCPNEDDYRVRLNFQMSGYQTNDGYKSTVSTWEELRKDYLKSSSVISMRSGKKYVKELFPQIPLLKALPINHRIQTIKGLICKHFEWDGFHGAFPDKRAKAFYNSNTGNRACMNFAYLKALELAGIKAYPALLGSANNGTINKDYPMFDNFTDVVVYIKTDEEKWVLSDATDGLLPFNLLPTALLNDEAYVLYPKKGEWVDIKRPLHRTFWAESVIKIDSTYKANVKSRITFGGYLASRLRRRLKTSEPNDIANDFISSKFSYNIDSVVINNKNETDKPLVINLYFSMPIEFTAPVINLSPFLIPLQNQIILKSNKRFLPLDFKYGREQINRITLQLPKNISLESVPESQTLMLPDKLTLVQFTSRKLSENLVQCSVRVRMGKAIYPASEYPNLKRLMDLNEAKQREGIVLKKN